MVTPRGATSGTGGGENRIYAINVRLEPENSPDVVTSMIKLFTFDVQSLLDPGSSLSFVTLYVANQFEILSNKLSKLFYVSTPVGESILVERVYRVGHIFINKKTRQLIQQSQRWQILMSLQVWIGFMPVMHQWTVKPEFSSFKFLIRQS